MGKEFNEVVSDLKELSHSNSNPALMVENYLATTKTNLTKLDRILLLSWMLV